MFVDLVKIAALGYVGSRMSQEMSIGSERMAAQLGKLHPHTAYKTIMQTAYSRDRENLVWES